MNIDISRETTVMAIRNSGDFLMSVCHGLAAQSGWWGNEKQQDPRHMPVDRALEAHLNSLSPGTGDVYAGRMKATPNPYCFGNKLLLIHSEVSEACEGDRKNLPDDKLPQYPMRGVELADAVIRCFDTAGAYNIPLGEIIAAKLTYNAQRPDHKPDARAAAGGKSY